MPNEFTPIIERDGPGIPGANGQGRTKEAARQNLAEAIKLILDDRRKDGLRDAPLNASLETVKVN